MKLAFFLKCTKLYVDFENAKQGRENIFVLQIIAFEGVPLTYLNYEGNSCDPQSTFYERVLRSQI